LGTEAGHTLFQVDLLLDFKDKSSVMHLFHQALIIINFFRTMSSPEAKTLRVCANSFLDHLTLVVETIEAFGPLVEES